MASHNQAAIDGLGCVLPIELERAQNTSSHQPMLSGGASGPGERRRGTPAQVVEEQDFLRKRRLNCYVFVFCIKDIHWYSNVLILFHHRADVVAPAKSLCFLLSCSRLLTNSSTYLPTSQTDYTVIPFGHEYVYRGLELLD